MGAETNTPADGREVDFFEALTGMVVDINHEVTKGMEEVGAVPETAGVVDEVLYKNWGIEQCDMVIEETSGSATGIVIGAIAGVSLAQSMDRREFMAGAGTGGALLGAGGMESAHAENLKFAPVKMTLTTTAEGGKAGTLEVDVYHYDSSKGQFAMTRTGTKKGGFFIGFERFDEGSKEQLRRHMVKQALTKHPERMSNKQGFEIVAGTRFTNKDLHVNYHYSGLKKSINPKVVSPLFALSEHVGAKKPDSYLGRNRWDDDTMSFLSEIAAPEIDGLKRERDKEYAILASAEAEATAAAEAEKIDATGRETAPGFPTEIPAWDKVGKTQKTFCWKTRMSSRKSKRNCASS